MICSKCHQGEVKTARVRAFSPALVVVGYACWALAVLGAAGATYYAYVHRAVPPPPEEVAAAAKRAALGRLRAIDNLPEAVVSEFQRQTAVSDATLESLGAEMQGEVEMLIADYHLATRRAAETPLPVWYESRLLWTIYGLSVFLLIAGASLMVRVDGYRCARCGALYDDDDEDETDLT